MSRDIDFSKELSEEDAEYVRQRDWLARDAELSGTPVIWPGSESESENAESNEDDEEEQTYDDLTVEELKEEIAARNEERDEDNLIEIDSKAKKADLVAALEADDEENGAE